MANTKIEWATKIIKNFWNKVDKTDSCWIWNAGLFKDNGYGQFRVGDKKMKAHRVSYMIINGNIPDGKILCHTCDNRKCVNPNHLILADHKFNAEDREKKGRGIRGRKIPKPKTRGSNNQIANQFNVSQSAIAQIIRGEKWLHVQR